MKKLIALLVCLCLLPIGVMAETESPTLPITEEPITLTVFTELADRAASSLTNYGEMIAFQELEKRTNIKLEFQHPPVGQVKEQFNLMIASGDLCDLIDYAWNTYPGGPTRAMEDGIALQLNDLQAQYAPNLQAIIEAFPSVGTDTMTDSGAYYMFPFVRVTQADRMSGGFQIRKDWLDKLGLEIPTTLDEWHTVLTAFKNGDPNGNGEADEIPFLNLSTANYIEYLTCAWGIKYGYYVVDGQVKFGPYEPEFKEYLTTLNTWYTEGLLDPDFLATDRKTFDAKVTSGQAGAYYGLLNSFMGTYTGIMKDADPEFNLRQAPVPIAPDGKLYNFEDTAARVAPGSGYVISPTNPYPVESAKLLDYFYSEEGALLLNLGIEGVTYNMVDGYPKYTELITDNPNGLSLDRAICAYTPAGATGRLYQDPRYWEQMMAYDNQKEAMQILTTASTERVLPPITPTPDESIQLASIQSEVDTYVDEMFARFVMNQEPLENFDNYIATLKSLNIEEGIAIQQAALERYYQRGK